MHDGWGMTRHDEDGVAGIGEVCGWSQARRVASHRMRACVPGSISSSVGSLDGRMINTNG